MNTEMENILRKIAIILKHIPNMTRENGILILNRLKTYQQATIFLDYLKDKTMLELKDENLFDVIRDIQSKEK